MDTPRSEPAMIITYVAIWLSNNWEQVLLTWVALSPIVAVPACRLFHNGMSEEL